MVIKLWYPSKGEFVKELEMPLEYKEEQTFSLIRYKRDGSQFQSYKQVFVRIGDSEYEFDHEVDL